MAYFIALLQLLSVLFVEMMQILNLVMLFDIKDIIENFVRRRYCVVRNGVQSSRGVVRVED